MDKHIIIEKIPGKQRGFNYIVQCPVCSSHFRIKGCHFNNNQRIYCSKSCRGKRIRSPKFTGYKTGKSIKNGYVYMNLVNQYEHRYIMEQHLNRKLESHEVVHHINHNRSDNKISNLELTTKSANSIEAREYHGYRPRDSRGRFL